MLLKSKIYVETFCDAVNIYRSTRKIIVCLYAVAYTFTHCLFTYSQFATYHAVNLLYTNNHHYPVACKELDLLTCSGPIKSQEFS